MTFQHDHSFLLVALCHAPDLGTPPFDLSRSRSVSACGIGPPTLAGCPMFPEDTIWNWPVDDQPLHPMSDTYVATIGREGHVHADFGSSLWNGGPIGIPFVVVPGAQPKVPVSFEYGSGAGGATHAELAGSFMTEPRHRPQLPSLAIRSMRSDRPLTGVPKYELLAC